MQLESLANELLLDLFAYIHSANLIRSFFGLNARLNHLLVYHFRLRPLDLHAVSKDNFDDICARYLPLAADQLVALRLSDEETPGLSARLPFHGFDLRRFCHIETLSLYSIPSLDTLYQLICQCQFLAQLTRLTIVKSGNEGRNQEQTIDFLAKIWSLPKLRYCQLTGIQVDEEILRKLERTSSTLEDLSMKNVSYSLQGLSHLLQRTPNLHRLSLTIYSYALDDHMTKIRSLLTTLKLVFGGSVRSLIELFQNLPELSHLTIRTVSTRLDGHQWESLIRNYLSKMTTFQLHMEMSLHQNNNDIEEIIDELLSTFDSPFWQREHQWPVRCHWNQSDPYKCVTLYTLPYAFDTFLYSNKSSSKSICLNEEQQHWSYDRVKRLDYGNIEDVSLNRFSLFPARFARLRSLDLYLPFDDERFFRHFPSFGDLRSLTVHLYKSSGYDQLQRLFCQSASASLSSFRFRSLIDGFPTELFRLTIPRSIRRVDLIDLRVDRRYHYTKDECSLVVQSSVVCRCEVLSIGIKSRASIFALMEHLPNLRLLIVECEDDEEDFGQTNHTSSARNDLVEWLGRHLPPTYAIRRDSQYLSLVQIWIHRETKTTFRPDTSLQAFGHSNPLSKFFKSFQQLFESANGTE